MKKKRRITTDMPRMKKADPFYRESGEANFRFVNSNTGIYCSIDTYDNYCNCSENR